MHPTRRAVLGMVAASTTLAGCTGGGDGGGSGDGGATSPTRTRTDSAAPEATSTTTERSTASTLQVDSHPEYGEILVGPNGRTLYMFDRDAKGEGASACNGGCAQAWPPLTVDGEPTRASGVTASVGTFERESGETQVTAGGWPLYYYSSDEKPGDAKGQGVGDVWWVLRPDGTPVQPGMETSTPEPTPTVRTRSHPEYGEILVGPNGLTLYMFDRDTKGEAASACNGGCAQAWPPLTVDGEPGGSDAVTARLTTFERDSGESQVAANGWPLYYYSSDEEPGDANGQGVGDVWWVLAPDGTPIRETGTDETPETSTGTPTTEPTTVSY